MATRETVMVAVMTALGCEADDGEDDRKVTVVTVKAMTTKVAGAKMPPQRSIPIPCVQAQDWEGLARGPEAASSRARPGVPGSRRPLWWPFS